MESITNLQEQAIKHQRIMKLKEPGSAITHFMGVVGIIIASPLLLIKAFRMPGMIHGICMILFVLGVLFLYSASTIYHALDISPDINLRLRKIDHMMIYLLIAGTYSPVCLIALNGKNGIILFSVVWGVALAGICQALFWITCPKWITSLIYVIMGWLCVFSLSQITQSLPKACFAWLLAGGIIYTIGAVIYTLKLPLLNKNKYFGSHEIFHIFCLAGTLCHYIVMYGYLAKMPI